ncbi:MFS transporter [Avibacterium paragallinarum]|uniref:MFS transporter n=1 Tax=Avibacterium paragallinarum TaxID=728 RepID=UPI003978DF15
MNKSLILLFAIAGGAAVGNLYWAQPLLEAIAQQFGVNADSAGVLVTTTQIGYALGVLLLVPLGDLLPRHRLILAVVFACVGALLLCALSPNFALLATALMLLGMTSVAGQILIPLAGDLADEKSRGQAVGTIVSGVLIGILTSRTISGLFADWFGWRSIYLFAAVVNLALALALWRKLPQLAPRTQGSYPALIGSVFGLVKQHAVVRVLLLMSAAIFAIFTLFWTALTFLLSAEPFHYSTSTIGFIGLAGLSGALGARNSGKLFDKGWYVGGVGIAMAGVLISLGLGIAGANSIAWLIVAIVLLDLAIQSLNVLNQTRLLSIDPTARSRLNTAFVCCNFIGGAIGSLLAGWLWHHAGWNGVMAGAFGLLALGFALWFGFRHSLLKPSEKNTV